MQIDPQSGKLFTDSGRFLKKLHCPRQKNWSALYPTAVPGTRHCEDCSNTVHDTAAMIDQDLIGLLKANPHACLKISFTQANCSVRPR